MDAYVLIDYDNLLPKFQNLTLGPLARRIAAGIDQLLPGVADIFMRLYGGWYSEKGLTRKGTLIAQDSQSNFPIMIVQGTTILRRIHCEIASALIDFKTDILMFTYRRRTGMRSKLSMALPSTCIN